MAQIVKYFSVGMSHKTMIKLARRWGYRNGYRGKEGGWIYCDTTGRVVCQGWLRLFSKKRGLIVESLLNND